MNTNANIKTPATYGTGEIQFSDLFVLEDIQRLQDLFSEATGVASLITSLEGRPITKPSNFCRLCKNIIRETEKGSANCIKSDVEIGNKCAAGISLQPCLSAGLLDASVRITVDGNHLANWLIGQVRNEETDEDNLKKYAVEIGADKDDFMKAFEEVPVMSVAKFTKVTEMLAEVANELSKKAYANLQLKNLFEEREKASELLRESEEKFRNVFENSVVGKSMTTIDGKLNVNKAFSQMLGYTQQELLAQNWKEITHPDDIEQNLEMISSILSGERTAARWEKRYIHKNGSIVWVDINTALQCDKGGKPLYFITTIIDINERKQAEETLVK